MEDGSRPFYLGCSGPVKPLTLWSCPSSISSLFLQPQTRSHRKKEKSFAQSATGTVSWMQASDRVDSENYWMVNDGCPTVPCPKRVKVSQLKRPKHKPQCIHAQPNQSMGVERFLWFFLFMQAALQSIHSTILAPSVAKVLLVRYIWVECVSSLCVM